MAELRLQKLQAEWSKTTVTSGLLDVFVEVDSNEHPQNAQNVHFNVESKDEFDQDKIDG